jgi:hypothetical protein
MFDHFRKIKPTTIGKCTFILKQQNSGLAKTKTFFLYLGVFHFQFRNFEEKKTADVCCSCEWFCSLANTTNPKEVRKWKYAKLNLF